MYSPSLVKELSQLNFSIYESRGSLSFPPRTTPFSPQTVVPHIGRGPSLISSLPSGF